MIRSRVFFLPLAAFSSLAVSPALLAAEEPSRKFFVNAYYTQAYGATDGGRVLGLDEDGTFDYRNAALLARYQLTPKDRFVVQLSNERTGASPLAEIRDDVEIDWAFYAHRFAGDLEVRLGRVPIPFGIYNEIRDVGGLLEFYRPPIGVYFEGAFSSEAVDGLVASKKFFADSAWSLEASVYAGTWDRPEYLAPTIYEGEADGARGLQLWLQTPVEGVQFGLAYQRFHQKDGAVFFRHPDSDLFDIYLASFDANLEHFVFRAEGQWIETSFAFSPKVELPSYYALAGWRFTEQFEMYGMFETSSSTFEVGGGLPDLEFGPQYEDRAIAMLYRLSANALIRVEAHHYETSSPDGPLPIGQATAVTDFGILSFSLSY